MFRKLPVLSLPLPYSAFDLKPVMQILAQVCFEGSRVSWGFPKETSKAAKEFEVIILLITFNNYYFWQKYENPIYVMLKKNFH